MENYTYGALDLSGQKVYGSVEAKSISDVRVRLVEKKLYPFKIKAQKPKGTITLKPGAILIWTQGLAQLVEADIALHEALELLKEQSEGPMCALSESLLQSIASGKRLSDALKEHPKIFDTFYVAMIVSAEAAGTLSQALQTIAELLKKKQAIRKKILSAVGYPAFLLAFCAIATTVLLTAVVPALEDLIDITRAPMITKVTFFLSHSLREYGFVIFTGAATFIGTLFFLRKRLLPLVMSLPGLRSFQHLADLENFSRLSSSLIVSGVGLFDTLGFVKPALKMPKLKEVAGRLEENLVQGELISYSLEKESRRLVPAFFVHMVAVGEKSADLGSAFSRIANYYEDKLSTKLSKFTALLQPALLLILATIIGIVMLSILMPMTDISLIDS